MLLKREDYPTERQVSSAVHAYLFSPFQAKEIRGRATSGDWQKGINVILSLYARWLYFTTKLHSAHLKQCRNRAVVVNSILKIGGIKTEPCLNRPLRTKVRDLFVN